MNRQINPESGVYQEKNQHIRIAILDLYNNEPNEGMRCILDILNAFPLKSHQSLSYQVYDVRFRNEIPGLDYDIYISTGGPGSPVDDGGIWEKQYFDWVDNLIAHNSSGLLKKHAFFICHSFQLLCHHLAFGRITKRHSKAFGIFPTHMTVDGRSEILFSGLPDPFYAVDSREWQFVQPDMDRIHAFGAKVLAIEKKRPHVPYERAVMAIRFTDAIFGTQFHPEADATGMMHYFALPEKKEHVIRHHGEEKYEEMLLHLNDPDKIMLTQSQIIPRFLQHAIDGMAKPHPVKSF